jgi:glucose-1-phosphate cytidylyltransferase
VGRDRLVESCSVPTRKGRLQLLVGILAGGLGTRLSEHTDVRPKPMVEVGGRPLLWHIMKSYATAGFAEFAVALGYRGEIIKDYFLHYHNRARDLTVDLGTGAVGVGGETPEEWLVHLLDTGHDAMTGDRVRQLLEYGKGQSMMLTYGDAVSSVNLQELLAFHKGHGKLATVTAVRPPARFGELEMNDDLVTSFQEKPQAGEGWINGGFFVCEAAVLDYIGPAPSIFEREPLEGLARDNQLVAFKHPGFWQCMDTLRDLRVLEELWDGRRAPWQTWR